MGMTLLERVRNSTNPEEEFETYQHSPSTCGRGTFYFTDCRNRMYSVRDSEAYHGCLCPKCFWSNKNKTLLMRGTPEANEYMERMRMIDKKHW